MRKILSIFLCLWCCQALFAEDYYSQHAVGWHWYDDPIESPVKKAQPVKKTAGDPIEQMNAVRMTIKSALDKAILEPSPQHIEQYIALQNQLNTRSEQVATTWQQVLLQHPELNYSLSHPTNNVALQVYHEEQSNTQDAAIKLFAKQTGLFFFYRSTCHYCQRFAPILKHFAEMYGITVIPITLDGITLPEFPDSKIDNGQGAKFHVTVTPSLFAVNPYTQKAVAVAYGLTSETELRDNIYKLVTQYRGEMS